jgi:hypothetical protein
MYTAQWPHLARVTNNLEPVHVAHIGAHLEDYSVEVQIDYSEYTAFIIEYSDWSEQQESLNQEYDW